MHIRITQKELSKQIETDMKNLFTFLDKKGILTAFELAKINNKMNKLATKQLQRHDKTSKKVQKLLDCTEVGLDMCYILGVDDTAALSTDLIREDFITKILEHRKDMENQHNREVEKTGVGYKSYLYQHLDSSEQEVASER